MVEVYTTYQMIVPRESVIQVPQKKTWSLFLELSARTKGRCAHFMALGTASRVSFLGRELGARARQLRLEALDVSRRRSSLRATCSETAACACAARSLADSRVEWMITTRRPQRGLSLAAGLASLRRRLLPSPAHLLVESPRGAARASLPAQGLDRWHPAGRRGAPARGEAPASESGASITRRWAGWRPANRAWIGRTSPSPRQGFWMAAHLAWLRRP
jgi:hypothetical protein